MKHINLFIRYILPFFVIILLAATTLLVAREIKKQQEIRSRASSGEKASLNFPPAVNANLFQIFDVPIVFSTDGAEVIGVDLAFSFDPEYLEIVDIVPLPQNSSLKFFLPQDYNGLFDKQKVLDGAYENNIIRFGAISYSPKSGNTNIPAFNGDLPFESPLVVIRFKAIKQGSTNLNFSFNPGLTSESTLITSSLQNTLARVNNAVITIGQDLIPSPTIASQSSTQLAFTIGLTGIGSSTNNKNPQRLLRDLNVQVFDDSDNKVSESTVENAMSYNPATGKFSAVVDMQNIASNGTYTIKVKSENYLRRLIPGIFTLASDTRNPSSSETFQVTLFTGDINDDNAINIFDYNVLLFCMKDSTKDKVEFCSPSAKRASDINDDGNVDVLDFNLFLRSLSVQSGD